MDVVRLISDRDPVVAAVAAAFDTQGTNAARACLVVGAPGFGKSSVLAAASRLIARQTERAIVWISGGVVASDGHLASLLVQSLRWEESSGPPTSDAGPTFLETVLRRLATGSSRVLLVIDDFDALVFKRERLAGQIAWAVASGDHVRLLASCHPGAQERLATDAHPFGAAIGWSLMCVGIAPLNNMAAASLIRRRVPGLPSEAVRNAIAVAAGHPAALVYLSRLLALRGYERAAAETDGARRPASEEQARDEPNRGFFEDAAEFAGAVYAEPWGALGPQQRAVLWQLSTLSAPASAAEIARAIALPASHVSAQLTRLVAEGLVRRSAPRGHFDVAPLLARWIARRAARSGPHVAPCARPELAAAARSHVTRSSAQRTHGAGPTRTVVKQAPRDSQTGGERLRRRRTSAHPERTNSSGTTAGNR